jgi:hypothetical protein
MIAHSWYRIVQLPCHHQKAKKKKKEKLSKRLIMHACPKPMPLTNAGQGVSL